MSLMTVPEVGRLRVSPDVPFACEWCGDDEQVYFVAKADLYLCDDCYKDWKRADAQADDAA